MHSDAISRCALSAPEDTLLNNDDVLARSHFHVNSLVVEQVWDLDNTGLKHHLDGNMTSSHDRCTRNFNHFVLFDSVLHRRNYLPYLLVIPPYVSKYKLMSLHEGTVAGHLGFFTTHERICCRYFWSQLCSSFVKIYMTSSRGCCVAIRHPPLWLSFTASLAAPTPFSAV